MWKTNFAELIFSHCISPPFLFKFSSRSFWFPTIVRLILSLSASAQESSHVNPFLENKSDDAQNIEAFLESCGSLAPKRYRYCDVKKITKSFHDKLGQGGYGTVYKGSMDNGCLVAVKMLSSSKGNGDEFINEVLSIGRTSHVNIVGLLGFCLEGSKIALIYEFMPNGSLDKCIYSETLELTLGLETCWGNLLNLVDPELNRLTI